MLIKEKNYTISNSKKFQGRKFLDSKYLEETFEFAWDMSFGGIGHHRKNRTGGEVDRKNGEIFLNTFQGKLAEFAIYQGLLVIGIMVDYPDLQRYGVGKWDTTDFEVEGMALSIKSTKHYGNLLLLETKDWDKNGIYIPNKGTQHEKYDYFILVRLRLQLEAKMKANRLLYSMKCNKRMLRELILTENIEFDIPGFIDHKDFLEAIGSKKVIHKGDVLNGKIVIDANNFYFETGEIRNIKVLYDCMELCSELLWEQRAYMIQDYIIGYY